MSHTFVIDTENNILRESFTGIVDLNALTEANTSIISDPRFKKGLNFLTDLRGTNIAMGYKEMSMHVWKLLDLGVKKQAFIVSRDIEFAISRMFEMLADEKVHYEEVRIFREVEDGLAWLGL